MAVPRPCFSGDRLEIPVSIIVAPRRRPVHRRWQNDAAVSECSVAFVSKYPGSSARTDKNVEPAIVVVIHPTAGEQTPGPERGIDVSECPVVIVAIDPLGVSTRYKDVKVAIVVVI